VIIPVNASGRQGNIENITALSVFGNNLFGESMSRLRSLTVSAERRLKPIPVVAFPLLSK